MNYTYLFLITQESILVFILDIVLNGENAASKDHSKIKFRILYRDGCTNNVGVREDVGETMSFGHD